MKSLVQSDWRDGFLFLGNQLALDFVNTRLIEDGKGIELLSDFEALLRWFHTTGLIDSQQIKTLRKGNHRSPMAQKALRKLRKLREVVRNEILDWESGAAVSRLFTAELNQLMAHHPMLARLERDGGHLCTKSWFALREPDDLMAPIARSAADLFSQVDYRRVRKCEHCILHFHDTSKIGTRRWCSMRLCGNRSKVAAYAARQRGKEKIGG